MKRFVGKLFECDFINRFAVFEEAVKASKIARLDAFDLGAHGVKIGGAIDDLAVVKADLIERIHRAQLDIVR